MAKIKDLKFELLPQTPHSPDIVLIYFYLFANIKKRAQWKRFTDDNQVSDGVNGYFKELDTSAYQSDITTSQHRKKCIELNGDYFET